MAAPTVVAMATLPNPLPRLAALGLDLPPGRLIDPTDVGPRLEPLLWLADDKAAPGTWAELAHAPRTLGLLPVVIDAGGGQRGPEEWLLAPDAMSYPGDHAPEDVLADYWDECAAQEDGHWPGLAKTTAASTDAPDSVATDIADSFVAAEGSPPHDFRLALVPARRSADIPTAIGWTGPTNHEGDTARLSAVLRSWEDRFGIRVVALGFDYLLVSVAAPPTTLDEAMSVAAEHFAFCPDNILQSSATTTLEAYAERRLLNQPAWHFWWD